MIDIFDRGVLGATAAIPFPALAMVHTQSAAELLAVVEEAGLVGKGGAGFPTHRKMALMQAQPAGQRCLVVNGGEHEPGSAKDSHLLAQYLQTVLEGALIMAHAVGAGEVRIGINASAEATIAGVEAALGEMADDALPRGWGHIPVTVAAVPDSYIAGEETALVAVLQGQPPLPSRRPPFPIVSGLGGAPTLVQNVETIAHLPYIVRFGAAAYRALGAANAGATLCTFGPEFANAGVRLVPLGITLREVVEHHGGGLATGEAIKAVQPGGPSAGFIAAADLDVPFDHASLKRAGSALGCGAIRAFPPGADMVAVVSGLMGFFAEASCGQCPSCRMQTQTLAAITRQVLARRGSAALLRQIRVIVAINADKGICGFTRMPGPPILSALQHFGAEFDRHIEPG